MTYEKACKIAQNVVILFHKIFEISKINLIINELNSKNNVLIQECQNPRMKIKLQGGIIIEKELLTPKTDVVFHSLFRVGNEDITKAFIEKIIQKKIKTIDLDKDKILDKEYTEQKLGILDLKVTLDNGTICNIEVQLTDKYNTEQRMLDYWAKLYGSQLKEGDEYQELKPVISILIADYELKQLKDEEAYTKWQIIETKNRKKVLTENLELHIIILPRALKELKDKGLKSWLMFLNNPNEQEVSEMAKEDKELGKAMEQLEKVSGDYHARRIAELREKAIRDEKSGLRGAREEGEQIGEKRGKKIEKEKIAKNMLEKGFDIETIVEITKLSKEEIMKL